MRPGAALSPVVSDDEHDEFLAAAGQAMHGPGDAALDALGFWDLLPDLDDAGACHAVVAAFRAQGRALASSSALGGVVAQPFLDGTALAPGRVVAALPHPSSRASAGTATDRRWSVWLAVGSIADRSLLFDVPGTGAFLVDAADVEHRPIELTGRLALHEVAVDLVGRAPLHAEGVAERARRRSTDLGRLALAAELLGASERAVDLAVEHAGLREQFGQPIGGFQAVRHLLAWARTDVVAIEAAVRQATGLLPDAPPQLVAAVKALAGRNARRACERSLQVLGGIGFTAEHDHHHHHSRVLLLDALLGSATDLTHELGAWLRTSGADPGFAAAALLGPLDRA